MNVRRDWSEWRRADPVNASLLGIILLALALRLLPLAAPSSFFPDEIFQYLDVAHRQVFGYGVETWEQRYGIRSPLFALILTVPMHLGNWLAPDGYAFLYATKAVLACASLSIIWAAYRLGRMLSPSHGLLAAFVCAIWFELVYFSTQALTEAAALAFFFPAAALMLDHPNETRARLFWGGYLLALAALLRFQYGPALIVFAALACGRSFDRWRFATLGAIAALACSSLVDVSQGMQPLSWLWANYHHNIALGRSYAWTDGPSFYPMMLMALLGPWLAIQIILAWPAGRIFPALAGAAITNIIVHTLIAHKEIRYILLSTAILLLLAAIGSVDVAVNRWGKIWTKRRVLGFTLIFWAASSFWLAIWGRPSYFWSVHQAELRTFQQLHQDRAACGVAIYAPHWSETGGYSYLHRRIPIYVLDEDASRATRATTAPAYNRILTLPRLARQVPTGFVLNQCTGKDGAMTKKICLYQRAGSCSPAVARSYEINTWLKRHDF